MKFSLNQKISSVTIVAVIIAAVVALMLVLPGKQPAAPTATVKVATTIFPLYDIARNVAGPAVEVVLLVPPGASPHTFEPRPSDMTKLRGAAAVYAIGRGLDDWTASLATANGVPMVVVDAGIVIRESAESGQKTGEAESDRNPDSEDPHYWLSAANGKKIATTVAADLTARFPIDAALFQANLQRYFGELDAADAAIRERLAGLANRDLVTLHDAWYYFAAAYGLNVVGSFEPSAGREPTPQYLTDLQAAIRAAHAQTLYSEPQLATASIEPFIRDNGLRLATLDPVGGVAGRESFIKLLDYNARTIEENQR